MSVVHTIDINHCVSLIMMELHIKADDWCLAHMPGILLFVIELSYFNGYYHGNLSSFNIVFSDLTEDDDDVQIVSKHK